MTPDDLKARTRQFAIDAVRLAKRIPRNPINGTLTSQLTRSATSTAAAYRAVCRARSRADFIYKLGNAIEEVDESALWLDILVSTEACGAGEASPLMKEADELTRIFVSSRETAR
jgi:four helix bundle protein